MTRAILAQLLACVLVLVTACDRPLDALRGGGDPVAITIEQIAEAGQPGQFTLSGTATLADQTPLTVSAVRRITPQATDPLLDEASEYAILDRQSAVVRDGRWQAQLSLWEVGPQGDYQENWQMANGTRAESAVSATVDFLATLEPLDLAQAQLKARSVVLDRARNPLLNFTPSGEAYLRVNEAKQVALPNARAATPVRLPEQARSTWEGRLTLDNPESRLTESPLLPFKENDNLPLPEDHLLR